MLSVYLDDYNVYLDLSPVQFLQLILVAFFCSVVKSGKYENIMKVGLVTDKDLSTCPCAPCRHPPDPGRASALPPKCTSRVAHDFPFLAGRRGAW
jgi:hypothetical protein